MLVMVMNSGSTPLATRTSAARAPPRPLRAPPSPLARRVGRRPRHGPVRPRCRSSTLPPHCVACCFVVVESSGGWPSSPPPLLLPCHRTMSATLPRRHEEGGSGGEAEWEPPRARCAAGGAFPLLIESMVLGGGGSFLRATGGGVWACLVGGVAGSGVSGIGRKPWGCPSLQQFLVLAAARVIVGCMCSRVGRCPTPRTTRLPPRTPLCSLC